MAIDNETLSIPVSTWITEPNVQIVSWNGDQGRGRIEYNDRKRLFRRIGFGNYFQEPVLADYILMIDEWMRRAASRLTLLQAKRLRCDIVDALYENKRIQPLLNGGYWYDATDKSLRSMISLSTGSESSGLLTGINNALLEKRNNENYYIIDYYNLYGADYSAGLQNNLNTAWYNVRRSSATFPGPPNNAVAYPGYNGAGSSYTFYQIPGTPNVTASAAGSGSIAWTPLNVTAQVSISYAMFSAALAEILTRRQTLDARKIAIQNSINAQTTISDVIDAVDVTFGW